MAKTTIKKPAAKPAEKTKTLDDLLDEVSAAQAKSDDPDIDLVSFDEVPADAPNKKAGRTASLDDTTREKMLAELAERFNTTPDEVARQLFVGEPVQIAKSPNNEVYELPKGTVLIPVVLTRDYWAHPYSREQWPTPPATGFPGDNRCRPGTVMRLPGKEARKLLASGAATRADPLPDEEGFD